jgi:hypothetical protein
LKRLARSVRFELVRVLDISGLDLNNPPEMELPELASLYETRVEAPRS